MRILILEDDITIAKTIELALKQEKIICDIAERGLDGLELHTIYHYDLIILDIILPDIEGYEVLQKLRSAKSTVPILILSGLDGSSQKVKGLGYGADDYLTKPFDKDELIARVKAIIRRASGYADSMIKVGKLHIDTNKHTVYYGDNSITLTVKEQIILEALALRKGQLINKNTFLDSLYNGLGDPDVKVIDVFVCKLRKKLADASGGHNYIETVWGRGYKLVEKVE